MSERDADDTGSHPLIGTLLRVPYSAIGAAVERGLARAGHAALSRSHFTVLQPLFVHPEGARLTDLANWAHVTKPSMVYLVQHLEARGYIERSPDPTDGRAQHVRLTDLGLDAVRTIRRAVLETEAAWADGIGLDRFKQLRILLHDLATVIGEVDEEGDPVGGRQATPW